MASKTSSTTLNYEEIARMKMKANLIPNCNTPFMFRQLSRRQISQSLSTVPIENRNVD